MKPAAFKQLIVINFVGLIVLCTEACAKNVESPTLESGIKTNETDTLKMTGNKLKLTIGSTIFSVSLDSNASVAAFKKMLPMTINMEELNANEKFYYFSTTLPTNPVPLRNIQAGDLLLYGNNCLVLFYETLTSAFSYTRLGRVDNITGLRKSLGTGAFSIRFELQ